MTASLQTKLTERWLWLRHCGWFSFAHKPLCTHYRHGVLRIGPLAVCRGCTLVYGAMAVALLLTALWQPKAGLLASALLMTVTALVLITSYPLVYWRLPRWACDMSRAGLGAVIGATAASLVSAALSGEILTLPMAVALLLFASWRWFGRVRQRGKSDRCAQCPEYAAGGICSGYAKQADSVRRYQDRLAEHVLHSSPRGPRP